MEVIVKKIKIYKRNSLISKYLTPYTYWVSYKIDEDRFWYSSKRGIFGKKHSHHTKNNMTNSIKIINGIKTRSEYNNYICEVVIENDDFYHNSKEVPGYLFMKKYKNKI